MKIVVAPDSFKECLSAGEVAATLARALRKALPGSSVCEIPLADGGEGTVAVLTPALGGDLVTVRVQDPLGRPVWAKYGVAGETAIIEVAQACGLGLLAPEERNPLKTSTYGVGELLLDAWRKGCRQFIVGLGGSATCDGGAGMLSVPGIRETLGGARFEILCDVDTPFVGPEGAARVFGPQKGASPEAVEILERRMLERAEQVRRETGVDIASVPGSGAAGGLGGAFLACFGATLRPGIDRVLDLLHFDAAVADAQLVITGEGRSDRQTLSGKAAMGVLRRSGKVPVALLSGRVEDRDALLEAGFHTVLEVSPRSIPLQQALQPSATKRNLELSLVSLLADYHHSGRE